MGILEYIVPGWYLIWFIFEIYKDDNLFDNGKYDLKGLDVIFYFSIPVMWEVVTEIVLPVIKEHGSFCASLETVCYGVLKVIGMGLLGLALRFWFDPLLNMKRKDKDGNRLGFWYYGDRGWWDPFMKTKPKLVQLTIRIVGTIVSTGLYLII